MLVRVIIVSIKIFPPHTKQPTHVYIHNHIVNMLLFLNTQDLFNPQNKFSLLPVIDLVGRPIAVFGNALIGVSIKGRGSLNQECEQCPNIPFAIQRV